MDRDRRVLYYGNYFFLLHNAPPAAIGITTTNTDTNTNPTITNE